MDTKGASKMKVIYNTRFSCIVLSDHSIDCDGDELYIAELHSCGDWVLTMNCNVPLNIATKIFQRWHQIDQSAEPEFIARALNDALNDGPFIYIGTSKWHLYSEGVFECEFLRELICDEVGPLKSLDYFDSLTVKHNIAADQLEYFVDDRFKGWLPIVRKEIAS